MLFKRRKSKPIKNIIKDIIWPSIGWMRSATYMRRRVERMDDSSRNIALGLAFGAAVSFSPLVGTHILQAAFLAWLFRANIVAAAIGTLLGNPWTFPFMWLAAIGVGSELFSLMGLPAPKNLPPEITLPILWDLLWHEPMRLLVPWLFGSYVLAAASAPLFYMIYLPLIRGAKAAAQKAKLRRIKKSAENVVIPTQQKETKQ